MTLSHATSSVTWPLDSAYVVSIGAPFNYRLRLSCTVTEESGWMGPPVRRRLSSGSAACSSRTCAGLASLCHVGGPSPAIRPMKRHRSPFSYRVFTRSSKRPAIHVYFEYICWKSKCKSKRPANFQQMYSKYTWIAGRLLDRVNTPLATAKLRWPYTRLVHHTVCLFTFALSPIPRGGTARLSWLGWLESLDI